MLFLLHVLRGGECILCTCFIFCNFLAQIWKWTGLLVIDRCLQSWFFFSAGLFLDLNLHDTLMFHLLQSKTQFRKWTGSSIIDLRTEWHGSFAIYKNGGRRMHDHSMGAIVVCKIYMNTFHIHLLLLYSRRRTAFVIKRGIKTATPPGHMMEIFSVFAGKTFCGTWKLTPPTMQPRVYIHVLGSSLWQHSFIKDHKRFV